MKTLKKYTVTGGLFSGDGITPATVGDRVKLYLDTQAHPGFPTFIVGVIQHPVTPTQCGTAISYSIEYSAADLLGIVAYILVDDVISVSVSSELETVTSALAVETVARIAADTSTTAALVFETAARIAADATGSSGLAAEIAARIAADALLAPLSTTVTLDGTQTLTNKTLTAPLLDSAVANSIRGSGGSLDLLSGLGEALLRVGAGNGQGVAIGLSNSPTGTYSVAEGGGTTASGNASHAEGSSTTASGNASHAEGINTAASGDYSHAEGFNGISSGPASHAEGAGTIASGLSSHAEGNNTAASGDYSHAGGTQAKALHHGARVCSDSQPADVASVITDSLTYRFANGYRFLGGIATFSGGIVGTLTGNASTATKLVTARTISGVSFDGSANIIIPASGISGLGTLATQSGTFSGTSSGTNTGDQTSVTGNSGTATALQTARTIAGQSFNGTANVTISAANVGAVATTGDETVAGKKTYTSKAFFNGSTTSDSSLQIGPVECQGFAINNAWVGENIFYNGTSYQRRSTGFTENVCFFGGEVQIRNANTGPAGSNPLDLSQFKASYTGAVAIGGSMSSAIADYSGCGLLVSGTNVKANFPFQVTSTAPATATSAGVAGTITYSAGFVYVCVATNIWQRAALITF